MACRGRMQGEAAGGLRWVLEKYTGRTEALDRAHKLRASGYLVWFESGGRHVGSEVANLFLVNVTVPAGKDYPPVPDIVPLT